MLDKGLLLVLQESAGAWKNFLASADLCPKLLSLENMLNSFEISNQVLKFENLIEIIILFKNLFQTWTTRIGAMCVCSCDKVEHMHMAPLWGSMI